MKESSLGPRKWAFVVISGGAACSLLFLHPDDSVAPARPQGQLNSGPPGTAPTSAAAPHPGAATDALGLPLPTQQLPSWANADRSPFDDLVGVTAAKPERPMPSGALPMEPLRPWISGPAESAAPTPAGTAPTAQAPAGPASVLPPADRTPSAGARPMVNLTPRSPEGAVAAAKFTGHAAASLSLADGAAPASESSHALRSGRPAEASPWHDENGWASLDAANKPIPHAVAQSSSRKPWPDQHVSSDEFEQLTRQEHRELASALVLPPSSPQLPSTSGTPTTRPAAVQLRVESQAPLPEPRQKHIIFQPSPTSPTSPTSSTGSSGPAVAPLQSGLPLAPLRVEPSATRLAPAPLQSSLPLAPLRGEGAGG